VVVERVRSNQPVCGIDSGFPEESIVITQSNLADTYQYLGQLDLALRMRREVYTKTSMLEGKESYNAILEAVNYASALIELKRFEEAKSLLRKSMPVARRVLGGNDRLTLKMRWICAYALYGDDNSTLDDLREAATTLEAVVPLWERIHGKAHPDTPKVHNALANARKKLAAAAVAAFASKPPP